MLENIKNISKTKFKKTNFKAFSFFLIFSLLIWILVQFSKTYEENVQVPIHFVQVPKDKIVSDEKISLKMALVENGFRIAWFTLFKDELDVDLSELETNGKQFVFNVRRNSQKIREQLALNAEEVSFLDDVLLIDYQQKGVKKIPVKSQISLDFLPGYASSDSIAITPDSIKVSGPQKRLDSLRAVTTVPLKLKKVDASVNGNIAIDTSGLGQLTFYRDEVNYSLKVEKFTEGKLKVPLHILNVPKGVQVVLFPKSVEVIFQTSLQNYPEISKSDFQVVCDYNSIEQGQQFFIPQVVKRPEKITNLRLSSNKVEFIIKK